MGRGRSSSQLQHLMVILLVLNSLFLLRQLQAPIRSLLRSSSPFFRHRQSLSLLSASAMQTQDSVASSAIQRYIEDNVTPFLQSDHQQYQYHFHVGNDAADADSIISALTNAFISQRLENSTNTVHIPLVAVPREEYELRPETNMLLSSLSINMSSIPSFADLTRNASFYRSLLARQGSVVFTLLDHNSPTERFRQLFPFPSYQVSAILDHHQDMGDLLDVCSGECREIAFESAGMRALVASTCTLVAERVLDRPPFLEPAALKEVVSLLYGVILIDSLNMDPRVQKGTPRDQRVLDRIAAQVLPQYQNDSQRATFFQSLAKAKTNLTFWRGVSLLNCLRYDYKLFFGPVRAERIGFSSVLLPIAWLLEKLEANAASSSVDPLGGLRDFYFRDQQLDLLVVLAFAEGRREILVLTARQSEELLSTGSAPRGATLLRELQEFFSSKFPALGAHERHALTVSQRERLGAAGLEALWLAQENLSFSRKQIAPIVSQFFDPSGSR